MSEEIIKTQACARLVSLGTGLSGADYNQLREQCVAVFVCQSADDARVLGRWLYEDVLLEVSFRRRPMDPPSEAETTVPPPAPDADTDTVHAPIDEASVVRPGAFVLPGAGWRIMTEDQAHELGLLLDGSRPTNSTERVRKAQRRLVELGLATFQPLRDGGKPACFITDEGKNVVAALRAVDMEPTP